MTPSVLIACLWGPMNDNQYDYHMLRKLNLLVQLRTMIPVGGDVYALYGDPTYPQSVHIFGGLHNPTAGSPEVAWGTRMSKDEGAEWGYKETVSQWRFLDFRALMNIFEVPVGRHYTITTFLYNL